MKPPEPLNESGLEPEVRRKVNALLRYVQSLRLLDHSDVEIDRTSQGTFIRPKGGGNTDTTNNVPRWG